VGKFFRWLAIFYGALMLLCVMVCIGAVYLCFGLASLSAPLVAKARHTESESVRARVTVKRKAFSNALLKPVPQRLRTWWTSDGKQSAGSHEVSTIKD
jgi:hypothetical protein